MSAVPILLQRVEDLDPQLVREDTAFKPWFQEDDLLIHIQSQQTEWRRSSSFQEMQATFNSANFPAKVTKVIGFGLGSCAIGDSIHRTWTCPIQHDLLVLLRELLCEKGKTIQCISQDPEYNETEKSIYGRQGIQVLEDPSGFLEVDDESIVITIAASAPVRAIVMDLAMPAAMVWMNGYAPLAPYAALGLTIMMQDIAHGPTSGLDPRKVETALHLR